MADGATVKRPPELRRQSLSRGNARLVEPLAQQQAEFGSDAASDYNHDS
jgi:hypothetical protein